MVEEYRDTCSAAITCYNALYQTMICPDSKSLNESIERDSNLLIGFEVLKKYDNVNSDEIRLLIEASRKLDRGEEVDLERILA